MLLSSVMEGSTLCFSSNDSTPTLSTILGDYVEQATINYLKSSGYSRKLRSGLIAENPSFISMVAPLLPTAEELCEITQKIHAREAHSKQTTQS